MIELGRALEPLPDDLRTTANKVHGRASQVWLATSARQDAGSEPSLSILGDSDAHIVLRLVAILLALCSGKSASEILEADPAALFERLGLRERLTPQRSNGFNSMIARVRADARRPLAVGANLAQSTPSGSLSHLTVSEPTHLGGSGRKSIFGMGTYFPLESA